MNSATELNITMPTIVIALLLVVLARQRLA
jgi:hypothetical protein